MMRNNPSDVATTRKKFFLLILTLINMANIAQM